MAFVPTLLILWPFALIGVTLVLIATPGPGSEHDDVWTPPRAPSPYRGAR